MEEETLLLSPTEGGQDGLSEVSSGNENEGWRAALAGRASWGQGPAQSLSPCNGTSRTAELTFKLFYFN